MMGSPDDAARIESFNAAGRRSIRAERIEAPLLILHGRKDKRVVPLMTERMVEALEIEGKTYEVHWYDEEGPRLGAPRQSPRRLHADPRVPQDPRPDRPARAARRPDRWATRRRALDVGIDADRAVDLEHRQPHVLDAGDALAADGGPDLLRLDAFLAQRLVEQPAIADEEPWLALDGLAHSARPARSAT